MYTPSSFLFDTPVINSQYLGVMVDRPIPKLIDDLSMTINETYHLRPDLLAFDLYEDPNLWWVFAQRNPNIIHDPIWDMKQGVSIFLPEQERLFNDLGI